MHTYFSLGQISLEHKQYNNADNKAPQIIGNKIVNATSFSLR